MNSSINFLYSVFTHFWSIFTLAFITFFFFIINSLIERRCQIQRKYDIASRVFLASYPLLSILTVITFYIYLCDLKKPYFSMDFYDLQILLLTSTLTTTLLVCFLTQKLAYYFFKNDLNKIKSVKYISHYQMCLLISCYLYLYFCLF